MKTNRCCVWQQSLGRSQQTCLSLTAASVTKHTQKAQNLKENSYSKKKQISFL